MTVHPGLAGVCAVLGLDPAGGELLQHAVNLVYRFRRDGLVVRLGPDSPRADALVRVAGELERLGVPAVRLLPGVAQPVRAAGWAGTVWRLLGEPPGGRYPASDLAGPLLALHGSRLGVALPEWDLLGSVRGRIDEAAEAARLDLWAGEHLGWGGDVLVDELRLRCDELGAGLARAQWALAVGTVHGDAHTGNLLRSPSGVPVLCDLDDVSWGPREVDLVPAAHAVGRFGRDSGDHARLVRRYGFDVRESSAWPVLRRLRDLQLAVYRLPELPGLPAAGELAHRLRTVLSGDGAAVWRRYPHMA